MANATIKFIESPQIPPDGTTDQDTVVYLGAVTFSAAGDLYVAGGLLPAAGFDLKSMGPYADRTPLAVYVESLSGSGWNYEWVISTGKLKIFSSAAGGATQGAVELSAGTALNTAAPNIFTDNVVFEARFPRR
jgi:hypothetical protein